MREFGKGDEAYPLWQINLSFLSNELEHTSMSDLSTNSTVYKLKEHRIFNMKSSKLLESRGRQKDLSTISSVGSVGAG